MDIQAKGKATRRAVRQHIDSASRVPSPASTEPVSYLKRQKHLQYIFSFSEKSVQIRLGSSMKRIMKALKMIFCAHRYEQDFSRPVIEKQAFVILEGSSFLDNGTLESLTPVICSMCGKRDVESNIV